MTEKLAQGSRERCLQIRIESQPETEVIIPNGSQPCELSTVTKRTQRNVDVLTNTKRAISKSQVA